MIFNSWWWVGELYRKRIVCSTGYWQRWWPRRSATYVSADTNRHYYPLVHHQFVTNHCKIQNLTMSYYWVAFFCIGFWQLRFVPRSKSPAYTYLIGIICLHISAVIRLHRRVTAYKITEPRSYRRSSITPWKNYANASFWPTSIIWPHTYFDCR